MEAPNPTPETEPATETETETEIAEAPEVTSSPEPVQPSLQPSFKQRLQSAVRNKKLSIPAAIIVLLLVLVAMPQTRYAVLGTVIKKEVRVSVIDGSRPVTSATVSLGGVTGKTDNRGFVTLKTKPGSSDLKVDMKYYREYSRSVTVPLTGKPTFAAKITATGRVVPVTVTGTIDGKPVVNAKLKAAGTEATTDKQGKLSLVLPAGQTKIKAVLTGSGYNQKTVEITVTEHDTAANHLKLTAQGKLYFLSKLSGKIDVVKTNLDGSDRQTVLAGTGFEDDGTTVLLASRDWKYLVLQTIRKSNKQPELDLIDTSNDKMSNIDEGDVSFQLSGWLNDYFVYTVSRNGHNSWESRGASIKSYHATDGKLKTLDSLEARGSSNYDARYETYNGGTNLVGDNIIVGKTWYSYPGYLTVNGEKNTLVALRPDGSSAKVLATVNANEQYFDTRKYEAREVYVTVQTINSSTSSAQYYEVDKDANYKAVGDGTTVRDYTDSYITYLASPSNKQTFWAEPRDGKQTLFIGDADGENGKQVASLSEYTTYGWFSDDYLLVSKNGSELFVMPVSGGTPLKISDYHKPNYSYYGYGGGYGGL